MSRLLCTTVSTIIVMAGLGAPGSEPGQRDTPVEVGNQACRPCHTAIHDSYSRTPMARTSGQAQPGLEGSFRDASSGVSYRTHREGQRMFLSYERSGSPPLRGTQELTYFLGSNTRGRAFLFDIDDFLYQTPIHYYASKKIWEMSPGSGQAREMELNHPVDRTCLFCHASRVQPPREGTLNGFSGAPFLQDGVGCERCHGPGSGHARGEGPMINPAALPAERRDDVCVQCHLEGEARITRAGRTQEAYRPGDRLSDVLAIFVREDDARRQRGAVSHVESLAASRCREAGGEALSCLTCHDPHAQASDQLASGHYRSTCLGCHKAMARDHYPRERQCTTCHMPRLESADIRHTAVTDHRIVRRPQPDRARDTGIGRLVQFGTAEPAARDLGLAYGEAALRGDSFAAAEALRLLEGAIEHHPADAEMLTRLGYLHQARGDLATAERYYERALAAEPQRAVVAANLGVFHAGRGMLDRSLDLWRTAFDRNPHLSGIGINLGRALCATGDAEAASSVLQRVLRHNPDSGLARRALADVVREGCRRE